jgi:glycosyltransferase involved in cell wall biosynthesis
MAPPTILMLLTNAYEPDPRVRQEALSLIGMGCRVRILAWDRDLLHPATEVMEGAEVERVFVASTHGRGATQLLFYAWLYLKLFWRGCRTPFNAVHCHDLDTLPLGFVLAALRRKPVVYDAHESFPDMLEGSVPAALRRFLVRLENLLIRRVNVLITVGEKLRRHFEARGASRTAVVGNWKRVNEFYRTTEQNADARQRLGIPANALVVVCITHLHRDRKIEELLDAAAASANVWVIVAGKGALEERVRQAAVSNPRVIYVGFVSGDVIADYTCAADVVYYGFDPQNPNARFSAPNKLFEALAAGRPLITGDFGEIGEVVRTHECGIVLTQYSPSTIRDAFQVLSNPDTREEMARRASQLGRSSLNWDAAEDTLYREYSRLLPGLRRPAAAALSSVHAIGH